MGRSFTSQRVNQTVFREFWNILVNLTKKIWLHIFRLRGRHTWKFYFNVVSFSTKLHRILVAQKYICFYIMQVRARNNRSITICDKNDKKFLDRYFVTVSIITYYHRKYLPDYQNFAACTYRACVCSTQKNFKKITVLSQLNLET